VGAAGYRAANSGRPLMSLLLIYQRDRHKWIEFRLFIY
jgi:hypothetical protein